MECFGDTCEKGKITSQNIAIAFSAIWFLCVCGIPVFKSIKHALSLCIRSLDNLCAPLIENDKKLYQTNYYRSIYQKIPEATKLTLVANQQLYNIPISDYIKTIQVPSGFDAADHKIIEHIEPGDLVITADIPLADVVIQKNALALNPRGSLYTKDNIKQVLSFRNLTMELRSTGAISGGVPKLSKKEIQFFANSLDKYLAGHSF